MSKKSINKKSVILTAGLGITIGTAAAIIPPLLNREVDKKEVIQVVDWKTSNVGLNNASVSFKLNLEDAAISKKAKAQLDQLKELKVNVIEPKTAHIESVNTATLDPQTNEFSFDVSNLNAGKIYNFNVVSLPHINFFFEINNNASFIVTKPELSRVDAQLDKRNAQLTLVFADDEHILNNKQAVIKYRKVSEVETKDVESVVKLEEVATSVGSKIKEIRATFDLKDLDRDTEYYIQSVEVDNEAISFSSRAERAFKTSTPTTTLENLEQTESTKNSAKATLSFDNSDIDIKDKQVNVYYAKVNKDETGETIGYGDELALESQTLKLEDPAQPAKLDLEFTALEEGSSYIITRITTIDPSDSSKNIEVIVPKEKEWSISTKAAIQSITHDTTAEKSDFMRVVLKDDSFTNNSKRAYVKYKLDSADESEAQIAESDITGNNVRFLLTNLTGLKPYSVLEFGLVTEAEDKTKTYTAMEFLDSLTAEQQTKMKSFVPTVSNVSIEKISISAETETTATVKVTFKKEDAESVLNRKAQLFVKGLGEKETYRFPADADVKDASKAVVISKDGEDTVATFSVTGLEGGIEYTVGKIELVEEDTLNEAENKLKADFLLSISGEERTFHTKPVVKDISYRGNDTAVTLAINIKNAYREESQKFEGRVATIKYKIKDSTDEPTVATETIKNNFVNLNLSGLKANQTYVITSITVADYQTSTHEDSDNLLSVSNISEEKKQFFTTAESANIVKVSSTAQSESTSQLVLTFDEPSSFLADEPKATLLLKYRKIGSTGTSEAFEAQVDKDSRTATFNFSNLSIGSQYIIDSIEVKKDDNEAKPVPKILFDALSVKEADKIFRTTNGISAISVSTPVETKARVTITLADASEEYVNKQVKITYAKKENGTDITSEPVSIINGKAVFDLSSLDKVTAYTIKSVTLVDTTEKTIPFESKITDGQKEFTTNAQTATVTEIKQLDGADRTKNSAVVTVKFQELDQYLKDGYDLKLKYRQRGTKEDKEATSTYEAADSKHKFSLSDLKEGAAYYITGLSAQKDGQQIEIIIDKISDENRIFWTKATVSSISNSTQQEEQAKLYVRFNDAFRSLIKKQIKVVVKQLASENDSNATEYTATATSDSGLFIFNLTGLPKATEMKVMKFINVTDNANEEIDFGSAEVQATAFETSRKFTTSAKTATVKAVEITAIERNTSTVKITFDDKEAYLVGKKVKLEYKGQLSPDAIKTEEVTITDDKTATFSLTGLSEGIRYTVTGFEVTDFKYPNTEEVVAIRPNFASNEQSTAKVVNRTFVTKSAVNSYEIQQKDETTLKVVVLIADNAKVKNGFKAKVKYADSETPDSKTTTGEVVISNGKAIFEVSNLTKSHTYIFSELEINDAVDGTTFTVLPEKSEVTEQMRKYTLVSNNVTVTAIEPTQTENTGSFKITIKDSDAFVNTKSVTLTVRKQGSQETKDATTTFAMENANPTATFNFSDLEGGSIYAISKIVIDGVPRTVIDPAVTDAKKQIATTPDIISVSFLPNTETNYKATVLIKDPLSGTTDDRKFDDKHVRITYYDTQAESTKLTADSTVVSSRLEFALNNLTKNRRYKVEKVEYAATQAELGTATAKTFVFNSRVAEERKEFHVIAKTATITQIEKTNVTDNSATVILKLQKSADEFMQTLSKKLILKYKSSSTPTQSVSEAVSPEIDGDFVKYTFNLNDLGHGAAVRLVQAETESKDIEVKFADALTQDDKLINTIASVRQITNSKSETEGNWMISVSLKDLNKAYDTTDTKQTKLKITYGKTADASDSHTSAEVNIKDGKAIFEVTGIEKFIDYTLKTVQLVNGTETVDLKFESTVAEKDKQFKVIPRIATVEAIENKASTTSSASFDVKFSEADKNYLKQYNKITLKYRLKGTDTVLERNATIDTTTLKASFSFTVDQDGFKKGNYEIFSIIFEGDVLGSTEVNVNNPNNVKVLFKDTVTIQDKAFETATEITSITYTAINAGAELAVRLVDTSSVFAGGEAVVVYTLKDDATEHEAKATIGASVEADRSEANILIKDLEKQKTYTITKVKINGTETPFATNFDQAQKQFQTAATNAEVASIEFSDSTINSDVIKVKFSEKDKFLYGSTFVEPNTTARKLILVLEAVSSGATITTDPVDVTNESDVAVATFNVSNLIPGETYKVTAINEKPTADGYTTLGLSGNIDFDSTITDEQKQFKTKPAINSVFINTQVETRATVTIGVQNDNLEIADNSQVTLEYKLANETEVKTATATYATATSKTQIRFELSDLQKGKEYQIVAVKNNNKTIDFVSAITEDNKKFTTALKTAEATISTNSQDWQDNTGTFTVTFGALDDYVNDGWNVSISYIPTDGSETKRTVTPVAVSGKTASFTLSNLTGGQFYKVSDVSLSKDNRKISATIKNPTPTTDVANSNTIIKVKSRIRDIVSASSEQTTTTIRVAFDNAQSYIANNDQLTITYEWVTANDQGTHQTTANANIVVDNNNNNNNNNTATFNLTNLERGIEYKIVSIKKGQEEIKFNSNLENDTVAKRRFITVPTSADVASIQIADLDRTTAKATLTFSNEFTKQGQQALIFIREKATPANQTNSSVVAVNNKVAEFNLTGLKAGTEYEIFGGALTSNGAQITIPTSVTTGTFVTKQEISTITASSITQSGATITVKVADEKNELNGHSLKLTVNKAENPEDSTKKEVSAQINNGTVSFTLTDLAKFTVYEIKSITDSNNSDTPLPFNGLFDAGQQLEATKKFKTTAQTAALTLQDQVFIADSSASTTVNATTDSVVLKFTANAEDATFLHSRNAEILYQELDSSGNETGILLTSPVSAQFGADGSISFTLNKDANKLKPGTGYVVKQIRDLSPASEKVDISIAEKNSGTNEGNKFYTANEVPAISSITVGDITQDGINDAGELHYKVTFEIAFDNTNEKIKWDQLSSATVTVKKLKLKENETDETLATDKVTVQRKNTENVVQVTIDMEDVRKFITRDISFEFSNFKYNLTPIKNTNETVANNINTLKSGAKLKEQIKPKVFVESLAYPRSLGNGEIFGITLKVYDPKHIFKDTPRYNLDELDSNPANARTYVSKGLIRTDNRITIKLDTIDAFGAQNYQGGNQVFSKNSDSSAINNKFAGTSSQKTTSGFKLKQSTPVTTSSTFTEFDGTNESAYWLWSQVKRSTENSDYTYFSMMFSRYAQEQNKPRNAQKLANKLVKIKTSELSLLYKFTKNGVVTTDITSHHTLLNKNLANQYSYTYPTFDSAMSGTPKYNKSIYALEGTQTQGRNELKVQDRDTLLSNVAGDPEQVVAIVGSTFTATDNTLKFRYNKPASRTTAITTTLKGYAVLQDDAGNLYFAGDQSGNPASLQPDATSQEITFYINHTGIDQAEKAPLNTRLRIVGIWSQEDSSNDVYELLIRDDKYDEVLKEIKLTQ
ncbi:hypothetical protein [Mycoplasma procyoni]|uniref:hypothetical protein n=1 Tax=Mycoplasma procyoni TaxID=568784 RepID=UPI00197B86E1|nr:hypothetical protein [Mycoplasma procyoni]MBN3534953.1 hypothetical protein [Mycoplasma procyoni]